MGIGLIGAALLGGAEGAGVGVATAGKSWTSELLEKAKQEAIGLREESLARLNNQAASERQQTDITARERLERDVRQPFEKEQQGRQFDQQSIENELHRQQQSAESDLARASHERIAKLGRDTQVAIAQMHGTVQVDKDGKIQWVGPEGKVVDTGLMSQKDLPPTAKVAADILRDQLKAIDKSEQDVMNASPEQQQKFAQQRMRVNGQLLAVLTGDLNKAFSSPETQRSEPPTVAIAALKKNPSLAPDFKAKYGIDPQQYLPKEESRGTPLADYPPGSEEAEAERPKPVGLIERKRREIADKKEKDEERKREYGDAGY